jgi:hypothetical protein
MPVCSSCRCRCVVSRLTLRARIRRLGLDVPVPLDLVHLLGMLVWARGCLREDRGGEGMRGRASLRGGRGHGA